MLIEMAIKGLMIDQVTSTPIIVLRDKDGARAVSYTHLTLPTIYSV